MDATRTGPLRRDPPAVGKAATARSSEKAPAGLRIAVFMLIVAGVSLLLAVDSTWEAGFVYAAGGAAVTALAMAEFARIVTGAGMPVVRQALILGGAALFLLQWAGWAAPGHFPDPWLTAAAVPALVAMVMLSDRVLRGQISRAFESVAATVVGLLYVPLLLGFLTAIRAQWQVTGLATVIVVCKTGTSGAYALGRLLGGPRLTPLISPRKTVAGLVGQFAGSVGAAYALSVSPWAMMGPAAGVVYGALVATAATFGDLAESLLKRQAALANSSELLPGLGGMLDMIDDMLFTAPVSYFFLLWCVPLMQGG